MLVHLLRARGRRGLQAGLAAAAEVLAEVLAVPRRVVHRPRRRTAAAGCAYDEEGFCLSGRCPKAPLPSPTPERPPLFTARRLDDLDHPL
uniref:Putative secreted protein n=1 Tax=Ixodes ricinus TaxID=34613 RepID=A0A6B0UBN8_IXORI